MSEIASKYIPFSPPDITESEIEAVCAALRSGWITTGKRTKLLEQRIADYVNVEKAVCLNSATAAMELTLRILGVGEGDEVIVPAYTYTATASVVCHVGAELRIVDCAEDSLEMDYDKMAKAINSNTKAIMCVDIGGCMCDYDRILSVVESKKHMFSPSDNPIQKALGRVAVISDSAHGLGAKYKGRMSGSVADVTSFSFHAVKNLTTGEGGAVAWRNIDGIENEWLYKQYMLASLHGQSKDALEKTVIGDWEYDIVYPAYKCNMTDYCAAIGLAQLDRYEGLLKRRKEIIQKYNAAFLSLGLKPLSHYTDNAQSSGHLYILEIPGFNVEKRNQLIYELSERGISSNVHYKPLPMMTAYKNLGFDIADYPCAYAHYEREITLPLHTLLTDEEVDYIIDNLTELLSE